MEVLMDLSVEGLTHPQKVAPVSDTLGARQNFSLY